MKARIKSTGEIVEVTRIVDKYVMTHHPHAITFEKDELDFDIEDTPDYWTRLEHQYAGMAMQSILQTMPGVSDPDKYMKAAIDLSVKIATALVQELKEKEERK